MNLSPEMIVERKKFPYRVIDDCALIVQISDEKENKLVTLNPTGTFIWNMADGSRSISEIAKEMVKKFGISENKALKDLLAFIKEMVFKELFSLKGGEKN